MSKCPDKFVVLLSGKGKDGNTLAEFPRPICDISDLNEGKGKFPYEVGLYHTTKEDETPQIIARLKDRKAAQALAKWYSANVYSEAVLVR